MLVFASRPTHRSWCVDAVTSRRRVDFSIRRSPWTSPSRSCEMIGCGRVVDVVVVGVVRVGSLGMASFGLNKLVESSCVANSTILACVCVCVCSWGYILDVSL